MTSIEATSKGKEKGRVSLEVPTDKGDDAMLEWLGYAPSLYRGFNWFMAYAFNFTAVAVFASLSALISTGLSFGGPVVCVWGWIGCSILTVGCGCAMAEICSTYPSAGSVYHWAGQLASKEWAPFMAYICGYLNFLGNAAGDCSYAYAFANVLVSILDLLNNTYYNSANDDYSNGYVPLNTQAQVGISMAILTAWGLLNLQRTDGQGWVNITALLFQVGSMLGVSTALFIGAYLSTNGLNSSSFVWTKFYNTTGFVGVDGYVVLLGLNMALFSFSGYEAGAHVAEETSNAARSSPFGMIGTCVSVAFVGFVYILGLLYAMPSDIQSVLDANSAVVAIFQHSLGVRGGLVLTIILFMNIFFAGNSSLTVTTRICYAMARDGALPLSNWTSQVWGRTQAPVNAIVYCLVLEYALLLLPLTTLNQPSALAFNAVTNLTIIGYQVSYAIPLLQRAYLGDRFPKSEVHFGAASVPLAWVSGLFLTFTSFIFFWPTSSITTPQTMNWVVVVVFGVLFIAGVNWLLFARGIYKGPARNESAKQAVSQVVVVKSHDDTVHQSL